ncbi:MAG TPA: hypothetical protein DEU95_00120, partial [Chloroflexi bacterium]|nr:hypothetical protein [Chloroflexota bacterium]
HGSDVLLWRFCSLLPRLGEERRAASMSPLIAATTPIFGGKDEGDDSRCVRSMTPLSQGWERGGG